MNDNAIESFINFCDDMKIVNESFIDNLKNTLKQVLLKCIRFLKKYVFKNKDSKIRKLLSRAEKCLDTVNKTSDRDDLINLQSEVDEISNEVQKIESDLSLKIKSDPKFNKVPKDIKNIVETLDFENAYSYILSTLKSFNVDLKSRKTEKERWKEFSKRCNCIKYFFNKYYENDNLGLFDNYGKTHEHKDDIEDLY